MNIQSINFRLLVTVGLAFATLAHGEEIYRCGNSYSQSPCADGKVLNIDETRDPARKKEVDAATRRDRQLADQLERERLIKEQALAAKPDKATKSKKTVGKKKMPAPASNQTVTLEPKRPKNVLHKAKDFTARTPDSEKKSSSNKKATQAKPAASK